MSDVLRVELPAELADELIDEGYEEFIVFRGAVIDAATVLNVAAASLAAGANVATILVARQNVGHFVAALGNWVRRKSASQTGGEVTIDLSARQGDSVKRLRVQLESSSGISDTDAAALKAFVATLFDSSPSDTGGKVTETTG
jgi:hypothetical protein